MPPQPADVASHDGIPTPGTGGQSPAEVQDHARPAVEEPGLDVEVAFGRLADGGGRLCKALVLAVDKVVVEDEADARAAVREVGHGPPALVHLKAAVGAV